MPLLPEVMPGRKRDNLVRLGLIQSRQSKITLGSVPRLDGVRRLALEQIRPPTFGFRQAEWPSNHGYFSLTKSRTKIAHTPTVMGNCATDISRSVPPRGNRYVSNIMAIAVSTPRRNLLFEFIGLPRQRGLDCRKRSDCTTFRQSVKNPPVRILR